jgi:hypothetical protein
VYLTRKVKVFLKSREIIDNWLPSALEYMKGKAFTDRKEPRDKAVIKKNLSDLMD